MQSMSKKNTPSKDRLSEMPDQVILHILSFMTTLDAVRTMLLRRFGNLWTFVPSFRFDLTEYTDSSDTMTFVEYEFPTKDLAFPYFAQFIEIVLMLHKRSTIDSFHLILDDYPNQLTADIQMWLRVAIERRVKDLFFVGFDDFVPPRCMFTSQYLTTLTLSACVLEHQHQVHMGILRKLSLVDVCGSNEVVCQLISGCPSLQELVIHSPQGLKLLDITNPSVSKLFLLIKYEEDHKFTLNCPSVKTLDIGISDVSPSFLLDVVDVSSLRVVNVMDLPVKCSPDLVKALARQFQNVGVFTLSIKAFEQLSCIKEMVFSQNRWKRLVLEPWWNQGRCLQVIIKLLISSVNLEELIIYAGQSSGNRKLLCPELSTSCVMPLLKTVTIHGFEKCCKGLLQLAEFLLRNATFLEKLVFTSGENKLTVVEELKFFKQVSRSAKPRQMQLWSLLQKHSEGTWQLGYLWLYIFCNFCNVISPFQTFQLPFVSHDLPLTLVL